MITIVILFNSLLALVCFSITWRVWQLRRALAIATQNLTAAEIAVHTVLQNAPTTILQGQISSAGLKQRYQQLTPQIRQVQQALALLSLLTNLGRRRFRRKLVSWK